jgi:virginiamycin B lyase
MVTRRFPLLRAVIIVSVVAVTMRSRGSTESKAARATPAQAVGVLRHTGDCARECITEFELAPLARPHRIVTGPDGALWFTMKGGQCETGGGNKIGRITTDGSMREFTVPTEPGYPGGITAGPDGALWFGEELGNKIGRITTDGQITEFPIATQATVRFPAGCMYMAARPAEGAIVVGPDGALWFGESAAGNIGRMTTDGHLTEFPIPTPNSNPIGITVGPDGALWFVERMGNKIGRITLDGAITEYDIPTPGSFSNVILVGPDGALWFSQFMGSKLGRITVDGEVTEFPLPGVGPVGIALAADGAFWVAGSTSNEILRVTTDGAVTHRYPVPTPASGLIDVHFGPDGNLWYTAQQVHKIGRLQVR